MHNPPHHSQQRKHHPHHSMTKKENYLQTKYCRKLPEEKHVKRAGVCTQMRTARWSKQNRQTRAAFHGQYRRLNESYLLHNRRDFSANPFSSIVETGNGRGTERKSNQMTKLSQCGILFIFKFLLSLHKFCFTILNVKNNLQRIYL